VAGFDVSGVETSCCVIIMSVLYFSLSLSLEAKKESVFSSLLYKLFQFSNNADKVEAYPATKEKQR
jgi:hypothetical protein